MLPCWRDPHTENGESGSCQQPVSLEAGPSHVEPLDHCGYTCNRPRTSGLSRGLWFSKGQDFQCYESHYPGKTIPDAFRGKTGKNLRPLQCMIHPMQRSQRGGPRSLSHGPRAVILPTVSRSERKNTKLGYCVRGSFRWQGCVSSKQSSS